MKIKDRNKKATEPITLELFPEDYEELVCENVISGKMSVIGDRESQQDNYSYIEKPEIKFFCGIICDGMGGLEGGSEASKVAVDFVSNKLYKEIETKYSSDFLEDIAEEANCIIGTLSNENGDNIHAGTTLSVAIIKEGKLHWVSVGDSKIYLFKEGRFKCLTNEHNYEYMAEQRKNDINFSFNPYERPDALVSFLGAKSLKYIDSHKEPIELCDGDTIIICSDGLYKALSEEEIIIQILKEEYDMQSLACNLVNEAISKPYVSNDNTTVIVMKYRNS